MMSRTPTARFRPSVSRPSWKAGYSKKNGFLLTIERKPGYPPFGGRKESVVRPISTKFTLLAVAACTALMVPGAAARQAKNLPLETLAACAWSTCLPTPSCSTARRVCASRFPRKRSAG